MRRKDGDDVDETINPENDKKCRRNRKHRHLEEIGTERLLSQDIFSSSDVYSNKTDTDRRPNVIINIYNTLHT